MTASFQPGFQPGFQAIDSAATTQTYGSRPRPQPQKVPRVAVTGRAVIDVHVSATVTGTVNDDDIVLELIDLEGGLT